jgi:flagellar motility protein MotE (MotC chaperone)
MEVPLSRRFRLLPLTILVAIILLSLKLIDVREGIAFAAGNSSSGAPDAQSTASSKTEKSGNPGTAPTGGAASSTAVSGGEDAGAAAAAGFVSIDETEPFTEAEIEVLQNLSERREKLESWEMELDTRAGLLEAATNRIDDKVRELKAIEKTVAGLIKTYDAKEEAKLKSLVKIYESMKAKDAARIFEQLEMPIILDVVERMREAKVALVLAKMGSEKAKTVTTELALRRQLPRPRLATDRDAP